jgi:hypothetical protein
MDIKEGEEVQIKGIHNIVHKIILESFPNLKNELPIQVQESSKAPNRCDQNRISPCHVIFKKISTENRKRILKAVKQKNQVTYKSKPIKIADFSTVTLKERRLWTEVF